MKVLLPPPVQFAAGGVRLKEWLPSLTDGVKWQSRHPVWQRLQAFCFAMACSRVNGWLSCSAIFCVFSKENLLPSALPTGGVSANEGPQLLGPWISFQVCMERWRKFDPITLVSNCATWSGWHVDFPQVLFAMAGSYPKVSRFRSCHISVPTS